LVGLKVRAEKYIPAPGFFDHAVDVRTGFGFVQKKGRELDLRVYRHGGIIKAKG
jgi:hypothetical protein